jgi:hypothetical protein
MKSLLHSLFFQFDVKNVSSLSLTAGFIKFFLKKWTNLKEYYGKKRHSNTFRSFFDLIADQPVYYTILQLFPGEKKIII